jgi:RND superfamily putative drug exporter
MSPSRSTESAADRPPLVERLAAWSARNRKKTLAGWLLLVVLAVGLGAAFGHNKLHSTDPGESGRAQKVLRAQAGANVYRENVLIQPLDGQPGTFRGDPALQQATRDVLTALAGTNGAVTKVHSPFDGPAAASLISADGRSVLVGFQVAGPDAQLDAHFQAAVAAVDGVRAKHTDVRIAEAGDATLGDAVSQASDTDLHNAELTSLPLTLVILLVVFGTLVAAGVPVLLSASAVAAALGVLGLVGKFVPTNSTASSVVLLIGMAVGVDYSLFYVRRQREERAAGRDLETALRISARTSGHAIAVSGLTVVLSLAGLFLTGIDVFTGMAVGTILAVGLAVLGSVTVLPAVLAMLGDRIDALRVPLLGKRRTAARESRAWTAVARAVVRRPLVLGGAATALLALLAVPALGMKLSDPAITNELPHSIPAVDAMARIQEAFPGTPSPAEVVVWGANANSQAVLSAVEGLHQQVAASGGALHEPISTVPVGSALVIKVPLAGSGTDSVSDHALELLRHQALPATLGKVSGIDYAVTGTTAGPYDFAAALHGRTPIVFGFVLLLSFVLLALAFRSLAVPLLSIALNLLSIAAAYGVVVLGFQHGALGSVLGFSSYGGVISWLPLFMFVVLFGLSMDYHVFILSRVRELWSRGEEPRDAVAKGIGSSAGVVSSAAVVMIAVFALFASLSSIEYKMLGVGMAVAVLIDATVVRGVLLPAALSLLGHRAWTPGRREPREDGAAAPAVTTADELEPAR